MPNRHQYQHIAPFIIYVFALILLYQLVEPLITIIVASILLAYVTYPFANRIRTKIPSITLSNLIALGLIILVLFLPFVFLVFEITQQGYYFYTSLSTNIAKGALFGFGCTSEDSEICLILNQVETFSQDQLTAFGLDKQLQIVLARIGARMSEVAFDIPLTIAKVGITIILAYFILCDWARIITKIENLLPLRHKTVKRLIHEFNNIAHTVIYAQLVVGIAQGLVAAIGFYIFGVPLPFVLGVLVAFFSLIPTVGTALIWVPASLYLIGVGYFSSSQWMLVNGICLFFYGLLIISTIDNILLAKIVKQKAEVSQILVIIGVIGGGALFGIIGIFIGPIILPLLITYFETFKERFV